MRTHPAHMHTISKPVHDMAWTPQPGGYCTVRPSMMMVSVPVWHPTRIPLDHVFKLHGIQPLLLPRWHGACRFTLTGFSKHCQYGILYVRCGLLHGCVV